jgi:hypothetical protein
MRQAFLLVVELLENDDYADEQSLSLLVARISWTLSSRCHLG